MYTNDCVILTQKFDANCAAKGTEQRWLEVAVPDHMLTPDEEEWIRIPLAEKPLQNGPGSSISGKLYKVQYIVQFSIRHAIMMAGQRTLPDCQIPAMIMTSTRHPMIAQGKLKRLAHGNWQPMEFPSSEYDVSEESE
jgi:hypothetical protein